MTIDLRPDKRKIHLWVLAAIVGVLVYFAMTTADGELDPPRDVALAMDRVGWRLQGIVDSVSGAARETNEDMQGVHDARKKRNANRIERDGVEAP